MKNILIAVLLISVFSSCDKEKDSVIPENLCEGVSLEPGTVCNPATGRIWMDKNLGASQVATSPTDTAAYGDLYQWGRPTDGHQIRTSPTTTVLSDTDEPPHGNYIATGGLHLDWRSPENDDFWQGTAGINNPCPAGFRVPTEAEWNEERISWSSNNTAGAFGSPLKLTAAGLRRFDDGSLNEIGSYGIYWSSSVSSIFARLLMFNSSNANTDGSLRAYGFSVRCIKD